MKCFIYNKLIFIAILILEMRKQADSLKCYQCSTTYNPECLTNNLNKRYLKECNSSCSTVTPVCRLLSQVQYFTDDRDVMILRECAYVYLEPLKCEQSKFSSLHFSSSCECNEDGCNAANTLHIDLFLYIMVIWAIK